MKSRFFKKLMASIVAASLIVSGTFGVYAEEPDNQVIYEDASEGDVDVNAPAVVYEDDTEDDFSEPEASVIYEDGELEEDVVETVSENETEGFEDDTVSENEIAEEATVSENEAEQELALEYRIMKEVIDGMTITVMGQAPEDAYLSVVPIEDDEKYEDAVIDQTGMSIMKLYDIKILYGEDEEYEPADYGESLTVRFEGFDEFDEGLTSIVHITEDDDSQSAELMSAPIDTTEEGFGEDAVAFETDAFSPYGVVTATATLSSTGSVHVPVLDKDGTLYHMSLTYDGSTKEAFCLDLGDKANSGDTFVQTGEYAGKTVKAILSAYYVNQVRLNEGGHIEGTDVWSEFDYQAAQCLVWVAIEGKNSQAGEVLRELGMTNAEYRNSLIEEINKYSSGASGYEMTRFFAWTNSKGSPSGKGDGTGYQRFVTRLGKIPTPDTPSPSTDPSNPTAETVYWQVGDSAYAYFDFGERTIHIVGSGLMWDCGNNAYNGFKYVPYSEGGAGYYASSDMEIPYYQSDFYKHKIPDTRPGHEGEYKDEYLSSSRPFPVVVHSDITGIGAKTLDNSSWIQNVTFEDPRNIEYIGQQSLWHQTITNDPLDLSGLKKILKEGLRGATGFSTLTIGSACAEIYPEAFNDLSDCVTLNYNAASAHRVTDDNTFNGTAYIRYGDYVFYNTELYDIDELHTTGRWAVVGFNVLGDEYFFENLGNDAAGTTINIGNGVKSLPSAIFANSLADEINLLPDASLESMGSFCFAGTDIKEMTVPQNVKIVGTNMAMCTPELEEIDYYAEDAEILVQYLFEHGNPYEFSTESKDPFLVYGDSDSCWRGKSCIFSSEDMSDTYGDDLKRESHITNGKRYNLQLKDTVVSTPTNMCADNYGLDVIDFSEATALKTIRSYAFSSQRSATEVIGLENTVLETVGKRAFSTTSAKTASLGGKELGNYTITGHFNFPDTLRRIEYQAFFSLNGVTEFTLHEGIQYYSNKVNDSETDYVPTEISVWQGDALDGSHTSYYQFFGATGNYNKRYGTHNVRYDDDTEEVVDTEYLATEVHFDDLRQTEANFEFWRDAHRYPGNSIDIEYRMGDATSGTTPGDYPGWRDGETIDLDIKEGEEYYVKDNTGNLVSDKGEFTGWKAHYSWTGTAETGSATPGSNPVVENAPEWAKAVQNQFFEPGDLLCTVGHTGFCEDKMVISSIILEPVFGTVNRYTVTYDGNGNTGGEAPEAEEVTEGHSVTVEDNNTLYKTHYAFRGWAENSTATVPEYEPGDSFTPEDDTTLYAVWEKKVVLTFSDSGVETGTVPEPIEAEIGEGVIIPASDIGRDGFIFGGWNKTENAATAQYEAGDTYTMPDHDSVLYPVWLEKVTLTFSDKGVTSGTVPDPITGDPGEDIRIPACDIERKGCNFLGWNESPDALVAQYEEGDTYTLPNHNPILYPVWEQVTEYFITAPATVTLELVDGTDDKCASDDLEVEMYITGKLEDAVTITLTSGNMANTENNTITAPLIEGTGTAAGNSFAKTYAAGTSGTDTFIVPLSMTAPKKGSYTGTVTIQASN